MPSGEDEHNKSEVDQMSNPYGPTPGGGPQGQGGYGGGAPSWAQNPAGPAGFGPPAGPGPLPQGARPPGPGFGPGNDQGAGQWGTPPPPAKAPVDLGRLLPLIGGVLGVVGFFLGFLPGLSIGSGSASSSISVYGTRGYLPILILAVGLFAIAPLLPGAKKYTLPTALLSIVSLLGALTSLLTAKPDPSYSLGFGMILLLVVAVLQAAAAVFAWLTESGLLKVAPKAPKAPKAPAAQPSFPSSGPGAGPGPSAPPSAGGFGGYASGGYVPSPATGPVSAAGVPAPSSDVPSYAGYAGGSYSPSPGEAYNPYARGQEDRTGGSSPSTGSTPSVDPGPSHSAQYGSDTSGSGYSIPSSPSTGQHGRDDGPPPDVTQQVRF
jgi:hypothetical protein